MNDIKTKIREELLNIICDLIKGNIRFDAFEDDLNKTVDTIIETGNQAKYIADHFSIIGIKNIGINDPLLIQKHELGITVSFRGHSEDDANFIHFLGIEERDVFFDKIKKELL